MMRSISVCTVILFLTAAPLWAADQKTQKSPVASKPKAAMRAPADSSSLTITDLTYSTEPDGTWYFSARVRNTGRGMLRKDSVRFVPVQTVIANGEDEEFALEPITLTADLAGSTGDLMQKGNQQLIRAPFGRAWKAHSLRLDAVAAPPSEVLVSQSIQIRPVDVRIVSSSFEPQQNRWSVNLKNDSPYTLSLVLSASALRNNYSEPAGVATLVIPPNQTAEGSGIFERFQENAGYEHLNINIKDEKALNPSPFRFLATCRIEID